MTNPLERSERLVADAYAFSRKLAQTVSAGSLHQLIVDTLARVAGAEQTSLALYDPDDGRLAITATHGYPAVLVEYVRICPGSGIVGRVLAARRPLLVPDLTCIPGFHARRPRYRTASFMALPLVARDEGLGVVSLADPAGGQTFTRSDLTAARALAAPAALALAGDRLARHACQLAHAATVDPLTGLFNRRYFHVRLAEEIERARRHGLDLALLIVDIDRFKSLNDGLGHLGGDVILRGVADILHRSVRVFDACTRYGGDEFAILMPGSTAVTAAQSAERIRQRVETYRPDSLLRRRPPITVSVGLAVLTPGTSAQDLVERADGALYRAKADGRNRVRVVEAD